jgi:hypothetical protein
MRILECLGVNLGPAEDMLAPHEADNPRGYREPRWMVELNDEILAALGTTWWQPFPGQPGWEDDPRLAPLRERAQALYAEKLGAAPLSGWKDPRTTLTLPFWQKVVPESLYVICVRNPIDAIASIQRRPEPTLPTPDWGELWLEYTARALHGTTERRRIIVFYADYFNDPGAPIAQLATLLGLPHEDERVAQAKTVVEEDLRHHRSSPLELAAAPGLSAPVRTVYLGLCAAHRLRHMADAGEDARQISEAIERVAVDAWRASREATATRRHAEELTSSAEQLERSTQQSTAELTAAKAHSDALGAHLTDAEDESRSLKHQLQTLQGSKSWRMTAPLRAVKRRAVQRRSGAGVT